jgi:hypothetical protein
MVKSALSKPMSEKIDSKEYLSNRKQVKEAQSSSTGFLLKKVEEVINAITTLHRNTSTNSEIPTTSKGGLLRAFDELSDMLEIIASNIEKEGLDETMFGDSELGEKKLTTAEKRKKEDIVMAMKKSFKGNEGAMYAIATDKAKIEENIQDDDVLGDMISDMLKYKTKEEVLQYLRQQVALHYDDVKDSKPKIPKGKMEEGMGNEVGDVVYFKGNLGEKYPASQGYYGVIEDVTPASNYNMLATYQVVVCDENDDEVGIVNTSFLNLSSKLKISTPKLKSMAEIIMSKLKGK